MSGEDVLEYFDETEMLEGDVDTVVEDPNLPDDVVVGEGPIVPEVGMKFQDVNEMFEFYKKYAYEVGFPVRKRNTRKDDDGVMRYITFVCSREGKGIRNTSGSLKPLPTIQSGCKARITASADACEVWRINTVVLEHNHKTSPTKSRLYRCNRELSAQVKRRLEPVVHIPQQLPMQIPFSYTQLLLGGTENIHFAQHMQPPHLPGVGSGTTNDTGGHGTQDSTAYFDGQI